MLAAFARTARDETDMEALLAELERVVQETLQPEGVKVWIINPVSEHPLGIAATSHALAVDLNPS